MRVTPVGTGEAGPATTREIRSLPAHAPGAVDTPFVIQPYDEVVTHDTPGRRPRLRRCLAGLVTPRTRRLGEARSAASRCRRACPRRVHDPRRAEELRHGQPGQPRSAARARWRARRHSDGQRR
ncbi:hypothetical protein BV881_19620 [Streptomyces sp. ZL-24]|nr:hypothetical protein BV881_19620 [Streptomyces sp. ZL-24]